VTVESPRGEQGCRVCGVVAASHACRTVRLVTRRVSVGRSAPGGRGTGPERHLTPSMS
jgi:hypothetical protein